MPVGDMGSTQSVRIVVCRKGTVDKNMENSKLNDRLKKQKNDKILQFIKENLDMGSTQSVRIVVCRKGTVDKNMENSKLNDRLKKQKNDKILQFIKENLRYFAAGALFVVMVTVLAMCARPQEGKMPGG